MTQSINSAVPRDVHPLLQLSSQPSLSDRAFCYGDGIFTTMRVWQGRICLWSWHWQRLVQSAQRLHLQLPSEASIYAALKRAITAPEQVLKLQISRGHGGRGYSPAGVGPVQCFISTALMPDYSLLQQQGVRVDIAELRLARQPRLAGIKHCSRLETVLLKAEVDGALADELLALDSEGFIIEASASNVFFYRDQQWYTPELTWAGVAGVVREALLAPLNAQQVNWSVSDLAGVEAAFLCSSLLGVAPIRQLQGRALALTPVQYIQQQYAESVWLCA
jgi:4-amino-4-deoxychorismate lyase